MIPEIFVFYIDSLEEVVDDKNQEKLELRADFLKSFQEFIDSHNYALFIVANPNYVNQLAMELDSIKNVNGRLSIANNSDEINSRISDFYKQARVKSWF